MQADRTEHLVLAGPEDQVDVLGTPFPMRDNLLQMATLYRWFCCGPVGPWHPGLELGQALGHGRSDGSGIAYLATT